MAPHEQTTITTRYGTIKVDTELTELIEALHAAGIRTMGSCQGSCTTWQDAQRMYDASRRSGGRRRPSLKRLERQLRGAGQRARGAIAAQLGVLRHPAYIMFEDGSDAARFLAVVTDGFRANPTGFNEEADLRANWAGDPAELFADRYPTDRHGLADLWLLGATRWDWEVGPHARRAGQLTVTVRFPGADIDALTKAVNRVTSDALV